MVRITPITDVASASAQHSLAQSFGLPFPGPQVPTYGFTPIVPKLPKGSLPKGSKTVEESKIGQGFDVSALNSRQSQSDPIGFSVNSKIAEEPKAAKSSNKGFDVAALNCCKPSNGSKGPAKSGPKITPNGSGLENPVVGAAIGNPKPIGSERKAATLADFGFKRGNLGAVGLAKKPTDVSAPNVELPVFGPAPKPDAPNSTEPTPDPAKAVAATGAQVPPCFQVLSGPRDPQIYAPIEIGAPAIEKGPICPKKSNGSHTDTLSDLSSSVRTAKSSGLKTGSTSSDGSTNSDRVQLCVECSVRMPMQRREPVPQRTSTDLWFSCSFGVLLTFLLMLVASYRVTYVITVQMPAAAEGEPKLEVGLLRDPESRPNGPSSALSDLFMVRLQSPANSHLDDPLKEKVPAEKVTEKPSYPTSVRLNPEHLARVQLLEKMASVMSSDVWEENPLNVDANTKEAAKQPEPKPSESKQPKEEAIIPKTDDDQSLADRLSRGDNRLPIPEDRMILD